MASGNLPFLVWNKPLLRIRRFCIALTLVVGLWSASQITLRAQLIIVGPPTWTSTNIQSVGGITYFVNTATFPVCDFHEYGSVFGSDTNLLLYVTRMRTPLCIFCFQCFYNVTNATVLGQLPPGNYRLAIYTLSPNSFMYEFFRNMDFVVPADSGQTMTVSQEGNGVRIAVNGVSAANYSVQTSTTLTNWTTITNVSGAPFSFTTGVSETTPRFYRVSVASGSVDGGIF